MKSSRILLMEARDRVGEILTRRNKECEIIGALIRSASRALAGHGDIDAVLELCEQFITEDLEGDS